MKPSQLKQKVEEWRAKRAQKIAERLQLHSNQRREVSSMVLGLPNAEQKINLPTPRAISRSTMDVRVAPARSTIRRSSSCGDIQQLKVLQNKKSLGEKVQYTTQKPLQPSSVPRINKKKQIKTPRTGTKETSSSKIQCNQQPTPKISPKKRETKVLSPNCKPSNSGRKSVGVLSASKQSEVISHFQEKKSPSSNLSNPIPDILINAETEEELNSTFTIGNSNDNVLTNSSSSNKALKVTFADNCEIMRSNHVLLEDSHDQITEDIFVDAVSDVEVNFSAHCPTADTAKIPCLESQPLKLPPTETESLVNKENILSQNGDKVFKAKLYQHIIKTENGVSLNHKTEEDISEKLSELFVTPSKELFVTPSKGPRKSRALVDSSNIVSSTSITFVAREIKIKENLVESKVSLTPVRRSTRLKSVDTVTLSAQEFSPQQLVNARIVPNPYLKT